MSIRRLIPATVAMVALALSIPATAREPGVLVFAAASLQTALDELTPALEHDAGVRVRVSYAATSALARQIEAGAPAAIFVSADVDWMDYVSSRGLLAPGTRVNLLGNRLVLIAPRDRRLALHIAPGMPLRATLGDGRLAIADPEAVPAGKYARAALSSLGTWDSVVDRLAPAEHVRAALLLVARGEAPLGIVYRSDALADPGVRIVDEFPASSHPPIVYPAAVTREFDSPAAARVFRALRSEAARRVFERCGFETLW